MVETDEIEVERRLRTGELACPTCAGVLAPWAHARERTLRGLAGVERLRPRRGCCTSCGGTHVLLPSSCLARRADEVAVIGAAVSAKATGLGHRRIAERLGRPASTVRGWLRAFAARAERIRAAFTALLHELDPVSGPLPPAGSAFADAVAAIGVTASAARRRLGAVAGGVVGAWSPWQLAAAVSGGRLLCLCGQVGAANTSWPWAAEP
jgi:hypothetical protein